MDNPELQSLSSSEHSVALRGPLPSARQKRSYPLAVPPAGTGSKTGKETPELASNSADQLVSFIQDKLLVNVEVSIFEGMRELRELLLPTRPFYFDLRAY